MWERKNKFDGETSVKRWLIELDIRCYGQDMQNLTPRYDKWLSLPGALKKNVCSSYVDVVLYISKVQ